MFHESRLSLKHWFSRRTSGPLLVGNLLVLTICILLVTIIARGDALSQQAAIDDLRQVAPRAITQQNRPMLEALLISFGHRVQASSLGLCQNGREILGLMRPGNFCSGSLPEISFFSVLKYADLPGMSEYRVFFVVPILPHQLEIGLVVLTAAIMLLLNLLLLRRVSSVLWRDLIEPLHGATLDKVKIAEVHDLLIAKEKFINMTEIN